MEFDNNGSFLWLTKSDNSIILNNYSDVSSSNTIKIRFENNPCNLLKIINMKRIFKNWKTTLCGLATILTGVKTLITTSSVNEAAQTIILGVGLIFAKDSSVTGN